MPTCLITPEALLDQNWRHVDVLRDAGFEILYPRNRQITRGNFPADETVAELSIADALLAGGEFLTPDVLRRLPRLRVIARCGVGYDRVNVPAATELGIVLTITPTANHEAAAEHALALMFAVSKFIALNDRRLRNGVWSQQTTYNIRGTTLGILGLGRIGRSLAVRGKALGMRVIAFDEYPGAEFLQREQIELVSFDTLLSRSDFLSIHCPLNDRTRGMFNASVFQKMKPGSVFINTARGGVMVEADLVAALQSGHLRAAGLDVFEKEPATGDNPLFRLDNVVVSPHLAGTDAQSIRDMALECATNIVTLSQGGWPEESVVNKDLKSYWKFARS
jgi:phosphoglycerate dehydrogenase-like enzyme